MKTRSSITVALLCLLCMAACIRGPRHDGSPLRCAISLAGDDGSHGRALLCGYNYELLRLFAAQEGREAEIRLAGHKESILDSLRHGKLDIVSFPYADTLATDSLLVWFPSDSCGIWVLAASDQAGSSFAGEWLSELHTDPDHATRRQHFLDIYHPMTRVSADFISPYDSLIRAYADTLGWDWKLLAALIYQESRFRIEARSPRGAAGIMQLVPNTARSFGCKDPLDPEENIRAGVGMLQAVEAKFRRNAADHNELTKFTLAAYNAGAARIRDCINYARHKGVDASRWENVAAVIPEMKHDSIAALDTIKLGTFYGGETVAYVRRVRAYYERYRHICR